MPSFIKFLKLKGKVVNDNHKPNKPKVPRPGGPILLLSIVIVELILYFITWKSRDSKHFTYYDYCLHNRNY